MDTAFGIEVRHKGSGRDLAERHEEFSENVFWKERVFAPTIPGEMGTVFAEKFHIYGSATGSRRDESNRKQQKNRFPGGKRIGRNLAGIHQPIPAEGEFLVSGEKLDKKCGKDVEMN